MLDGSGTLAGRLLWPPNWSDPYFGHFFHQIKKRGGQSGGPAKIYLVGKSGVAKVEVRPKYPSNTLSLRVLAHAHGSGTRPWLYDMDAIRFKQPAHQVNSVQYLPGYNWLSYRFNCRVVLNSSVFIGESEQNNVSA